MNDRVGAFESIYAVIYFISIGNAISTVWSIREQTESVSSGAIVGVALIVFITAVFLRNYHVLHEMDRPETKRESALSFVDSLPKAHQVSERVIRLTMILLIVLMPKSSFLETALYEPFRGIMDPIFRFVVCEFSDLLTLEIHEVVPFEMADRIGYHAFVMLLLFSTMYAWDLVTILGLKKMVRESSDASHISQRTLQYLDYINRENLEKNLDSLISKQDHIPIGRWYIRSPKFLERSGGVLCAYSIFLLLQPETHALFGMVGLFAFIVYIRYASMNNDYFSSLTNLVTEPVAFLRIR